MTITYTHEVANCTGFGCFWKLLFRWRGSIYKLVWPDLLLYTLLYYSLRFVYQYALVEPQKRIFEQVSLYCQQFTDLIPVSFVLGFYVSIVVQRWWAQYECLPWPDSLATLISVSIHGQDERSRLMRRSVIRYINLCQVLTLIMISPRVKKRFPTLEHLVEAGFMTENEKKIFDHLELKTNHPKYWMPLVWAGTIVSRARKEGRIRDDFAVKTIVDLLNTFRGLCGGLLNYDWISIPLVYTQVVTLAVYSFFLGTLFGRQFLDLKTSSSIDLYVPWFTFLQFFFYMGWLKVAETLVNPFGEDDDDFELNWLIDRNLQVSYLIVDEMHSEHPELIQDKYWDEVFPQELPYTIASEQYKTEPPQGSTAFIEVPEQDQEFLPLIEESDLEFTAEEEVENIESGGSKSSRAIDIIKGRSPSMQSNLSRLGSIRSGTLTRKPSTLSNFLSKLLPGSNDGRSKGERLGKRKKTGSRGSLFDRHLRKSSSRRSSASRNSPTSIIRNQTSISTQDSDIFHMSSDCLPSPEENRLVSLTSDDDGHIIIKIKKRNDVDQAMNSFTTEGGNLDTSCNSTTNLISSPKRSDQSSEVNEDARGSRCSIEALLFGNSEKVFLENEQGEGNSSKAPKFQVQPTKSDLDSRPSTHAHASKPIKIEPSTSRKAPDDSPLMSGDSYLMCSSPSTVPTKAFAFPSAKGVQYTPYKRASSPTLPEAAKLYVDPSGHEAAESASKKEAQSLYFSTRDVIAEVVDGKKDDDVVGTQRQQLETIHEI